MLLRIVAGRRGRFGVHYLQYVFDGAIAMKHLSRHHIDGTTPILPSHYGRRRATDPQIPFGSHRKIRKGVMSSGANRRGVDND